jgi:hypothetical protein
MGTEKLANLTAAQTKSLTDGDTLTRSAVLALMEASNLATAAQAQYNGTTVGIIGLLDGTEPLPTSTGLAGATPFASGDQGYIISYLNAFTTWYAANLNDSAHQAMWVKSVGAINMQSTG